jgi:hypothetical protein
MDNIALETLDTKLSPKQISLLDVLGSPEYARKTIKERIELAGITKKTYYTYMRQPKFLQALKVRGLNILWVNSLGVAHKFVDEALKGKYYQQKDILQSTGVLAQTPLIQQVIANITKSGLTEEEIDKKIAEYFVTIPQAVVCDTAQTTT